MRASRSITSSVTSCDAIDRARALPSAAIDSSVASSRPSGMRTVIVTVPDVFAVRDTWPLAAPTSRSTSACAAATSDTATVSEAVRMIVRSADGAFTPSRARIDTAATPRPLKSVSDRNVPWQAASGSASHTAIPANAPRITRPALTAGTPRSRAPAARSTRSPRVRSPRR
jgi:hypothetical protein